MSEAVIGMNSPILLIARILSRVLNPFIFLVGIIELCLMLKSWFELSRLKKRIDRLNGTNRVRRVFTSRDNEKHTKSIEYSSEVNLDWDEFDRFCDDNQKQRIWYSAFAMIIQMFTLLGILGTVAGLFISLQAMDVIPDANQLFDGVRFALSSTILGIILAVFFKIFDIILCAMYVNYIDDGIMRFDNNYKENSRTMDAGEL